MQSTYRENATGQLIIENQSKIGAEQLVVTVRPDDNFSTEFELSSGIGANALIASIGISIDRAALHRLVDWLRDHGAVS